MLSLSVTRKRSGNGLCHGMLCWFRRLTSTKNHSWVLVSASSTRQNQSVFLDEDVAFIFCAIPRVIVNSQWAFALGTKGSKKPRGLPGKGSGRGVLVEDAGPEARAGCAALSWERRLCLRLRSGRRGRRWRAGRAVRFASSVPQGSERLEQRVLGAGEWPGGPAGPGSCSGHQASLAGPPTRTRPFLVASLAASGRPGRAPTRGYNG